MVSGYVTDLASPHRRDGLKGRRVEPLKFRSRRHTWAPLRTRPAACGPRTAGRGRPLLLFRDHVAMHVRAEDFRYDDGTVSLLVVFQDSGDGTADSRPEPFRVWTNSGFDFGVRRKRILARRAWKSSVLEHDEISRYFPCAGNQTSTSKVLAAEKPISPVQRQTSGTAGPGP